MSVSLPADHLHLHLRRVEPERGMARFYSLTLQPNLFGELDLVRRWGRMGTHGMTLVESYPDQATARTALVKLAERKRRRGYA